MKIFKTNGPGLLECIKHAWGTGRYKYFFHNLSCELRRGRYKECYGYTNTWYDRFLFSLGVFIMDPIGKHQKAMHQYNLKFNRNYGMTETQYERHPAPWVRSRAKLLKQQMQQRDKLKKEKVTA